MRRDLLGELAMALQAHLTVQQVASLATERATAQQVWERKLRAWELQEAGATSRDIAGALVLPAMEERTVSSHGRDALVRVSGGLAGRWRLKGALRAALYQYAVDRGTTLQAAKAELLAPALYLTGIPPPPPFRTASNGVLSLVSLQHAADFRRVAIANARSWLKREYPWFWKGHHGPAGTLDYEATQLQATQTPEPLQVLIRAEETMAAQRELELARERGILSEQQAIIIQTRLDHLRRGEDVSWADVAREIGKPEGQVRVQVNKLRGKWRAMGAR
jgi:hypothetical protein